MRYAKKSLIWRAFSVILLLFTLGGVMCGCTSSKTVQTDIVIIPSPESYDYDEAIVDYAKSAIYFCLYEYEAEKNGGEVSGGKIDSLIKQAEEIQKSLPTTLEPSSYMSLFSYLASHSKEIAASLALFGGADKLQGFEALRSIYLELTELVDGEYIGELLYNAALAVYDEKYEAQILSYEKYGQKYMLDKANEYAQRKEVFINEIGKKNALRLIEYSLFIGDLYYGTAFDGEEISRFTNEEILIFLKALDLSGITVTEKGYELILTTYAEAIIIDKSKSFFDKVIFAAEKNGDVTKMSVAVKELISLLAKAQTTLTTEDIELLRQKSFDELILSLIERFDEEAWARFDSACTQEINKEAYNTLAKSYYGEDFDAYLQSCKSATIEELKEACGEDSFNQTLKEYIFGICPAFSYNMNF